MRPACLLARPFLVAAALEGRPLPPRLRRHTGHCLRCAALEARTRSTRRILRSMAGQRERPPPEVLSGAIASLHRPGAPNGLRRRWPPVAAGAVLLVAALAWGRRLLQPA